MTIDVIAWSLSGHLVQVLGYEVKEEEVAHLLAVAQPGLRDDIRDLVARNSPSPRLDHGSADACGQEDGAAVGHEETSDGGEKDEPEPEKDVDLLVNDVEWQHAQPVVTLHRPAWSVLWERALGNLAEQTSTYMDGCKDFW